MSDISKPDYDGMIAIIQARRDGKTIEYRGKANQVPEEWIELYYYCDFDFHNYEYRVKPEPPKPREWWLILNGSGDPIAIRDTPAPPDRKPRLHVREVLRSAICGTSATEVR